MRRFLYIVMLAASLQACADMKLGPTPAELQTFAAGGSSVIVINTGGKLGCDQTILGIHRDGADKNEVIWTVRDLGYATTTPAVMVVPPGNYHVSGAACMKAGYYPATLNAINLWFGSIDVKAGEVVYMGTLNSNLLDFKTEMSGGMKALNAIFFTGRDANEFQYVAYDFSDETADVLERMRVTYPDLAGKMVLRIPPAYVTKENFAAALARAYAANPDGTLPTTEQAQARLPEELKKVGEEAIRARNADRAKRTP